MENLIQRILLVTYLTKYNINEIHKVLKYEKFGDYVEGYLANNKNVTDIHISEANKIAKEKYEEMKYLGIKFLPITSEFFPKSLKSIDQCPPLLFYKGELKQKENVAIIGSRNTTSHAEKTVEFFLNGLSKKNGVVSGLALGVDTLAHKMSLDKGIYNIAVVANSLNSIYPKENYKLANRIIDNGGCIISELAIGINRGKKSFVERNRLQSGLSDFVIPIEMGIKSGTMHTIDFCIRQDKWVINKAINKETVNFEQYSGIASLKNKIKLKQIVVTNSFDINEIKKSLKSTGEPTLFD